MRVGDRFLGRGAAASNWWQLVAHEQQDACERYESISTGKAVGGGGGGGAESGAGAARDPCVEFAKKKKSAA